jgi:tRNA threonylcarbamoyl adenosine modification protein (Sua5/YciO/YrdC/YwlC family)
LLASGVQEVIQYGGQLDSTELALAGRFWPGPLTLVLAVKRCGTELSEGFRVPDHGVALALLRGVGGVMRVSSANRSGRPPALCVTEAIRELGSSVTVAVDSGDAPGAIPSTVVKLTEKRVRVLRQGALPAAAFAELGLEICDGDSADE